MTTLRKTMCTLLVLLALVTLAGCGMASGTSAPTSVPMPTGIDAVPRITPQELKAWLDGGKDVVIVDVRSRESYEHSHILGALSIPVAELDQRYEELPREKDVVLY